MTSLAAAAQAAPLPLPEISADGGPKDGFPRVEVAFPDGVRALPEVRYSTPFGFRPLTMDIYQPPQAPSAPARGYPMVMYIHGGGWLAGNSHSVLPFVDFPRVLASIAARGFVVASVNYRLSGEAPWPAQAHDIKAAIRYLRVHAAEYRIDPDRFATWGVSAGGHLAAIAAAACDAPDLRPPMRVPAGSPDARREEGQDKVSECVQAAVAWYGVFDMATIPEQAARSGGMSRDDPRTPEWLLMGCFKDKCSPAQLKSASPMGYVTRDTAPMLLVVGDKDRLVPHEQTLEMAKALEAAGVRHELIVIPGVNHSLLGTTAQATRKANLDALERTMRFLDGTIGAAR